MGNSIINDGKLYMALKVIGDNTTLEGCHKSVPVRKIASSLGIGLHRALAIAKRLRKKGLVTSACLVQRIGYRKFRITKKGEECLSGISS